jgi:hypothetical protein
MSRPQYVRTPNFVVKKPEGLPIIYATGVFGGLAPNDGRMLFIADRLELEPSETPGNQKLKEVNQEVQAEIHMSPLTFKSVALWMNKQVEIYENVFGEVKAEPISKDKKLPQPEGYVK